MPNFTQEDLFTIRQRVLAGEDIPIETMREVITFLRADRVSKIASVKKPKKGISKEDVEKIMGSLLE